jgi:hypothetical protein
MPHSGPPNPGLHAHVPAAVHVPASGPEHGRPPLPSGQGDSSQLQPTQQLVTVNASARLQEPPGCAGVATARVAVFTPSHGAEHADQHEPASVAQFAKYVSHDSHVHVEQGPASQLWDVTKSLGSALHVPPPVAGERMERYMGCHPEPHGTSHAPPGSHPDKTQSWGTHAGGIVAGTNESPSDDNDV